MAAKSSVIGKNPHLTIFIWVDSVDCRRCRTPRQSLTSLEARVTSDRREHNEM